MHLFKVYSERILDKHRGPSTNTTVKIQDNSTIPNSSLMPLCNHLTDWLLITLGCLFPFLEPFTNEII